MKKMIFTVVAALMFTSLAYAAPITFTDTTLFTATGTLAPEDLVDYGSGTVNRLGTFGDFVLWRHNFTFVPPASEIKNATLRISLVDDERDTLNLLTWEFALGFSEGGQWDFGAVDTETYHYGVGVSAVDDGDFWVKVASFGGDFLIQRSDLEITYQPVPEPSTMLLFAGGMLAAGCFARRRMVQS